MHNGKMKLSLFVVQKGERAAMTTRFADMMTELFLALGRVVLNKSEFCDFLVKILVVWNLKGG